MVSIMDGAFAGEWIESTISRYLEDHNSGHWWCNESQAFSELLEAVLPHHDTDTPVQALCNMLDKQVEGCLECLGAHHRAQVMIQVSSLVACTCFYCVQLGA